MSQPITKAPDELIAQLAALEEQQESGTQLVPTGSTAENVKAELETFLSDLRQPLPRDEYADESACEQVIQLVQTIGREPSDPDDKTVAKPTAPAESSTASAPTLASLGHYELLSKIGEGGMGAVYKARNKKLDKIVALKVLPKDKMQDKSSVARFEREMRAVGKLDHPHIVRAMDAGEENGMHFLVMEYVQGIDLSQLVKRLGPLPVAEACELIRQAAVGLDAAHDHGMVHRDIKPSNLMLCAPGKRQPPIVKILDLGLALLSEAHRPDVHGLTSTGQMMGTVDYMAPEQGDDSKSVDIRADLYSLGASLYKLLTGETVYHGGQYQTLMQKMMALASRPAPPIRECRAEIPPELAVLVHRLLEKDPAQRFATPEEVAQALTPFAAGANLAALLTKVGDEGLVSAVSDEAKSHATPSPSAPDVDTGALNQGAHAPRSPIMSASAPDTDTGALPRPALAAAAVGWPPSAVPLVGTESQPTKAYAPERVPSPQSSGASRPPARWNRAFVTLVAAMLLLILGPLSYFFGGTVIRLATNKGELVIETDDPNIEVTIKDSIATIKDKVKDRHFVLTAGDYDVEVRELGEGGVRFTTKKFSITRNGKETFNVELELAKVSTPLVPETAVADSKPDPADPQRRFAEWVLSAANQKVALEDGVEITSAERLPKRPFQMKAIHLVPFYLKPRLDEQGLLAKLKEAPSSIEEIHLWLGRFNFTDETLAQLVSMPDRQNLKRLRLKDARVTDAGLVHLRQLPNLEALFLEDTLVTNAGLNYIGENLPLRRLQLGDNTPDFTEVGLAHLGRQLEVLGFVGSWLSDAGLDSLPKLPKLGRVDLAFTQVTNAGVERLIKQYANLSMLRLWENTHVTEAVLPKLTSLKSLRSLGLRLQMPISDAGFKTLSEMKHLTSLELHDPALSAERVAALQAALPGCKIVATLNKLDAPPESADLDRRAAEWVLSIGGSISIKENGKERQIAAVGDLPRETFELTIVGLDGLPKVSDAGLAHFKDCKSVTSLHLKNPRVGDTGLSYFKDCKNLTFIDLTGTKVSDAGLAHFKDCKNLTDILLLGTDVGDTGMLHFKDCKNLRNLCLANTKVGDAGLSHFKDCKSLTSLDLHYTQVSDAGLAHFKDCMHLTEMNLAFNLRVTDAGLAYFKDRQNLTALELGGDQLVSDAGLAHFKDFKNLTSLSLGGTQVSDAGLAYFKDCKNLTKLNLSPSQVTDAGLAHFKDCKNLKYLYLESTRVSDSGLAFFQDCQNLVDLRLSFTHVSDAGLSYFKNCKDLTGLHLSGSMVSDAGLAHFKDCKNLTHLHLNTTQVSNAALPGLAGLQSLENLGIASTRISLGGYEQLKAATPKCQITWSEPNRSIAEQVLALGGEVEIATPGKEDARPVKSVDDLPREFFQVRRVSLASVTKPLDNLPQQLSGLRSPEFDRLENLDLSDIKLPDFGFLASIHGLRELSLVNAGLNDESLAKLPKLPTLKRLVLDGNEITGRGLSSLNEQPELIDLSLGCPSLTDLLVKNLAEMKQLKRLSLAGSGLSDVGIKHLAGLKNLESLDLRRTKATAAGVAELQKALPKCQIEWDGS